MSEYEQEAKKPFFGVTSRLNREQKEHAREKENRIECPAREKKFLLGRKINLQNNWSLKMTRAKIVQHECRSAQEGGVSRAQVFFAPRKMHYVS